MPAQTVFVSCAEHDGFRTYKVHVGRLGEFPREDRFSGFPDFASSYAFFEAEKLPKGGGWRFLRRIPLTEVHPAMIARHQVAMQRIDRCRTRGPAPNPQATDW